MAPRSREADARIVTLRATLLLLVVSLAALAAAPVAGAAGCSAGTHGSEGYAYAGHQSASVAHGVRATITALSRPSVPAGHVAGWVGVGGPGQGAHGETVWLQAGIASLPGTPPMVYAEITRAGKSPVFLPLVEDVAVGESHRVAVLEVAGRPGAWRVWVDGAPVTDPIVLPGSSGRWRPIATAESWDGGTRRCNGFSFRFDGVAVATQVGGRWRSFVPGFRFLDRGYAVRPLTGTTGRQRTLASDGLAPYAFVASSV